MVGFHLVNSAYVLFLFGSFLNQGHLSTSSPVIGLVQGSYTGEPAVGIISTQANMSSLPNFVQSSMSWG